MHTDQSLPPPRRGSFSISNLQLPSEATVMLPDALRMDLRNEARGREYRQLMDNLLEQMAGESRVALNFVSCEAGAGVTDALLRLALMLSDHFDGRILLVDGDAQSALLSKRCALTVEPGLIEVLNANSVWRQLVRRTSADRLDILPIGRGVLGSTACNVKRTAGLLEQLGETYRFVLLDSGDIHSQLARCMARSCSASYVFVRIGQTDAERLVPAVQGFQALGAHVQGCIITRSSTET